MWISKPSIVFKPSAYSYIKILLNSRNTVPLFILDGAYAFDKVLHEDLIVKQSKLISGILCHPIESYFADRMFRVA